jgi:hypothetical protein
VHQAKGNQFANVELLDDAPHISKYVVRPDGSGGVLAQFDMKAHAEDVNMLYVGVTRATERLAIPPGLVAVVNDLDKMGTVPPIARVSLGKRCRGDESTCSDAGGSSCDTMESDAWTCAADGDENRIVIGGRSFTGTEAGALRAQVYDVWVRESGGALHVETGLTL